MKQTATIEFTNTHVLILCPLKHLVESFDLKDWAGSNIEMEVAEHQSGIFNRLDRLADKCNGFGHHNYK